MMKRTRQLAKEQRELFHTKQNFERIRNMVEIEDNLHLDKNMLQFLKYILHKKQLPDELVSIIATNIDTIYCEECKEQHLRRLGKCVRRDYCQGGICFGTGLRREVYETLYSKKCLFEIKTPPVFGIKFVGPYVERCNKCIVKYYKTHGDDIFLK